MHTEPGLPTGVDTGIRLVTPDAKMAHAKRETLGLAVGELLASEFVSPYNPVPVDGRFHW